MARIEELERRLHGKKSEKMPSPAAACANAESDLAMALSRHLGRPREAKKALSNLLNAPGHVRIGRRTLSVRLKPAGTTNELSAFAKLADEVNAWNLTLPGDPRRRRLRFSVQVS